MKEDKRLKQKSADEEAETRWSLKRIAIFLSIVGVILFALFYVFEQKTGNVLGEKDLTSSTDRPQISLPNRENIEDILETAQDSISKIDTNDIVSSQPQIDNAINELKKLTQEDNIKKSICATICSE